MTPVWKHMTFVVAALAVTTAVGTANAQYVVSYYQPYTSYYAPPAYQTYSTYYTPAAAAYQTYYAPTAYQSYYAPTPVVQTSSWYPGYWWDRTRAALFGTRTAVAYPTTTYAASYPSTYAASYPSTYAASYPTNYVASYPTSTVAAYAPSTCCAPVQQVTMRPVCAPACSTCDTCTGCGVSNISQTSYIESAAPACTNCTTPAAAVSGPTPASPSELRTFDSSNNPPGLPANSLTPEQRSQTSPATEANKQPSETGTGNGGATNNSANDPLQKFLDEKETRSFFQPPELFDPKDKTVKSSPAPVHMAVYKRPAGAASDRVTTRPISLEKARRDAAGWTSASK